MTDRPEIFVLGPILVGNGDQTRSPGGRRSRAFLAALTISVNHAVRIDTLVDVVWTDRPPASIDTAVHSLATRMRELLGPESVVLEDHAYRLVATCDQIDACRFERLSMTAEALLGDDPAKAVEVAREALGLWRGPAYSDLADQDPFRLEAIRLEELRVSTTETLVAGELAIGQSTRAIPMLFTMLEETPYREHLWGLLIEALGATGRRGEAITVYERYELTMKGIGLEPGRAIEEALHRALDGDAAGIGPSNKGGARPNIIRSAGL